MVQSARMRAISDETIERAGQVFARYGGTMRMSDAVAAGIHRRTLYAMHDAGLLLRLSRGVYRLAELPELSSPDLATVAARAPDAVICLISALAYHELTTQIPHWVDIAIRRHRREPRIAYPPTRVFEFGPKAFAAGIEEHLLDGIRVRIYEAEKTLADCFKYRNRLGLDIALEALRLYLARPEIDTTALIGYARICRVERVMRPYVEALL